MSLLMQSAESSENNLPSGLPVAVSGDEDLARFITQSNWVKGEYIKEGAFMPDKLHHETSVTRKSTLNDEQLTECGAMAAGERSLYGAAVIACDVVRSAKLEVESMEPPAFHAVINRWPTHEDPAEQKAQCKALAQILAADAKFLPLTHP